MSTLLLRTAAVSGVVLLVSLLLAAAVEAGALRLGAAARTGLDRFLGDLHMTSGIWAGLVPLCLSQVTVFFQHRATRKVLDEIAASQDAPTTAPVVWQHAAVRRVRAGAGMGLLAFPFMLFSGFWGAVGIVAFNQAPQNPLAIALLVAGPLGVALGIWMAISGNRRVQGPARDRWGDVATVDGLKRHKVALRQLRLALRTPAAALAAIWWLAVAAAVAAGFTWLLVGQELAGPGLAGTVLLVGLLLGLLLAAALGPWLLRRALLREASDPTSPAPPPNQLHVALRQEAPNQSVLDAMLLLALALLVVGLSGMRTGPEYPLQDLQPVFRLAATLGGIGVLFHASGIASGRAQIRAENEYLSRRWPPGPSAPVR